MQDGPGEFEAMEHEGAALAFARQDGASPTFVWLPGFKSDMAGTKARHLSHWAAARGQTFLRFDYSGHGRSGGFFEHGTISRWLGDALAVIEAQSSGPLVLVGSSMGAWIALLAARALPARVKALLLVAPAPDFTERLLWPALDEEARQAILEGGRWLRPSAYDPEPFVYTRALFEDGRDHLVMNAPIAFAGPVRILQGEQDPDVPARHALDLAALFTSNDLVIDLVPDGDHRLSRPQDLDRLAAIADRLADRLAH